MRTAVTELLGIELPIFAFSHCRDVVAAVSRAGGFGCLGCGYFTQEQLEEELRWIDDHVDGKPYGVDILMPGRHSELGRAKLDPDAIPQAQVRFLRELLDAARVPGLPQSEAEAMIEQEVAKVNMTREESEALLDVVLRHPVKMVVNALGVPSREQVDRLHARGIRVGGLVGKVEHALRQREAGVDVIVAVGAEGGGHTGSISSMILWPQVVDAVAPTPVLAAGGVGSGRQMAAALALGASGVWCGSIWLGTKESDLLPEEKEALFEADAEDAVQTLSRTGKQCRVLRSRLTDAWEAPDAPPVLPMPQQTLATMEARLRINRGRAKAYMSPPVGQIVHRLREETTVRQVIADMLMEFSDSIDRIERLLARD